jgi:transposase
LSSKVRPVIKRQYRAEPIIDPNPTHKKAVARTEKTPEWRAIYNKRTAVERLNARLKGFRKLNDVRVRGRFKVRVHAMLAVIVCQAMALATGQRTAVRKVA